MVGKFLYDEFGDCTIYFFPKTDEDHYFIQTVLKFMDFEIFGGVIQKTMHYKKYYKVKIYSSKMSSEAKKHFKDIQRMFDKVKL